MAPEPDFAEQYTTAERLRFLALGGLAGLVAVYLAKAYLFPWIGEFAATAHCREILGIPGRSFLAYGLFVAMPLHFAVIAGGFFGWRGYRILRDGQCPPKREKVFRPTSIRRGTKARLIGYLHFLVPLIFLAMTLWGVFQAERLSGFLKVDSPASRCGYRADGGKG